MARNTDVEVYGKYAVLIGLVTTLTKLSGLNIFFSHRDSYPTQTYPESIATLKCYLWPVMAVGSFVALTVIGLNSRFGPWLPIAGFLEHALSIALFLLSLASLEVMRFYQSIGRSIFSNWTLAIGKAVTAFMLIIAVALYGGALSLATVLLILTVSQLINFMIQIARDPKFASIFKTERKPFEPLAIVRSLPLIPSALFYEALSFIDRYTISRVEGFEAAGHYSIAAQGAFLAYAVLGGGIISYFYPRLVLIRAEGPEKFKRTARLILFAGAAFCIVGAFLIMTLSWMVPLVFGERYSTSVVLLELSAFIPLFLFILSMLTHLAYLNGDAKKTAVAFSFGIPIIAGLNVILVGQFGSPGAIAATYLSLSVLTVWHVFILFPTFKRGL
ncbi:oligosaccharide flippase family protein [Hyphomicrobium sp.]|uniref:oligosaccharide flippase family protein n=1 Tax=Hyphomicrobium sp. TaxID=82 RepID=UPI003F73081F